MRRKSGMKRLVSGICAVMLLVTTLFASAWWQGDGMKAVSASGEMPTDYTNLTWRDFTGLVCKEYINPNPDGAKGTYSKSLNKTLFSGELIMAANTDFRYAGTGWSGLLLCADMWGNLVIESSTFATKYEKVLAAADYGLTSFAGNQFSLKISTTIEGSNYTFGIWVNDKYVDTLTLEANEGTAAGSTLGLYGRGSGNITLIATPVEVPEGFTELQWGDFEGLTYQQYAADGITIGTYGSDLDKTFLNADVIMSEWTDIRYACQSSNPGWSGLIIGVSGDGNNLSINSSTFDTPYVCSYAATDYGLSSFSGQQFNLKISVQKSGNSYTFGIWVNNQMLGDYFTLTENDGDTTAALGLYRPANTGAITLVKPKLSVPTDLTELSWTDFAGLAYKDYDTQSITTGNYPASLDSTMLNANMIVEEGVTLRYANTGGWAGLLITAATDANGKGVLNVNSSTFVTSYNKDIDPTEYGLDSFLDAEFNMKLATRIRGDYYTFGIWINDSLFDYFTLKSGVDSATGSMIGIYSGSNKSIILKAAPEDADTITDFAQDNWDEYSVLTPYKSFGIEGGVYQASDQVAAISNAAKGDIEKFDKVVLHVPKITYSGCVDLGFGGASVWEGFRLRSNNDGTLTFRSGYTPDSGTTPSWNVLVPTETVLYDSVSGVDLVGGTYDLKISMLYTGVSTIKLGFWFNNKLYNNNYFYVDISGMTYTVGDKLGTHLGVVSQNGGGAITFSGEQVTLPEIYWDVTDGSYTVPDGTKDADGKDITALSRVGDYEITYVEYGVTFDRMICIYETGNIAVDDVIDIRDLVRLKKIVGNISVEMTKAGMKAADIGRDGDVDADDVCSMRSILVGFSLEKTVAEAMLGKEDVMPIIGYYGPASSFSVQGSDGNTYTSKATDTEEIYKLIADVGVNVVTAINDSYMGDNNALIRKHLQLAQKNNLSVFVRDRRVSDAAAGLSSEKLQSLLDFYRNDESFAGFFLADEPKGTSYPKSSSNTSISELSAIAKVTNRCSDIAGYVNLLPYYESNLRLNDESESDYQGYLTEYIESTKPRYLSFDHYLFSSDKYKYKDGTWFVDKVTDGKKTVAESEYYIKNMVMVRNAANTANIPFWFVLQAGANWNDDMEPMSTTTNNTPTEGEFKWQVSTALAFGAKGITYFPLLQPHYFALTKNAVMDYQRNGLIAEDGTTTKWYNYAKEVNDHIAVVDEVLMNADNEAVIPVCGYAAVNITSSLNDKGDSNLVRNSYKELSSVSTTQTTYGAVVGCFDYNGKTALYVVNYDVTSQAAITLNFSSDVMANVTIGTNTSEQQSQSMTLNVPAGEGALVVLK